MNEEYLDESSYENEKLNKSIWKRLFAYLVPHKKYIILGILSVGVIALLDAVYPQITKYAMSNIIETNDASNLKWFIILFVSYIIIQTLFVMSFIHYAGKVEVEMAYDLRKDAFTKIQKLPFEYYDKTAVGWIMARMTSDSRTISEILSWDMVDLVWGIATMLFILIFMFISNWKLALIAISIIPILAVISIYCEKKELHQYRKVKKINSKITGAFNEGITGAKTIKTMVLDKKMTHKFEDLTGDMKRQSVKAHIINAIYTPSVIAIGGIASALVYFFGGHMVIDKIIDVATLYIFVSYVSQFFDPIYNISTIAIRLKQAQASAERIISLIDEEPSIKDTPEVIQEYGDEFNLKLENFEKIKGDIEFKNIEFKYKTGEKILSDFNLKIKAGEKIALVGSTGAGKTTIVSLLSRFYEPTSGEVLIDGVDYRKRSMSWLHKNVRIVLQTPHLFSGSIKDNIAYGKLDATKEEIMKAAEIVRADKFISKFEKGYDTEVGDGGSKLSQGEKQLVSFARAIIDDPRIVILDEATSSVDTETEYMIQGAIDRLLEGRTSLIVAHRLSTIVSADRILVIDKGKIVEEGNHNELIAKKGRYYKLYTNQFTEEMLSKSE